jgi:MFS superfamily sulfate permease-like transporter
MLIVASQLKHLMGVTYDANGFVMTMVHAAAAVPRINPFTLSIGMAAIGAMHGLKEANKKFLPHTLVPEQLAVVIVFTVLAWALHLGDAPFRVALVGHVDTSLPTVRLPPFCLLTLSLSFPGPGVGVT